MAKSNIETTYTLADFIASGKMNTVDYDQFSYKDLVSNGTEVSILNVINDYMREIKDVAVKVELSTQEYLKYRYKPKLLCRDVYGNGEVYYVIMLLNGRIDVKEHNVFVAVKRGKVRQLLSLVQGEKIKGIKTLVEEAK